LEVRKCRSAIWWERAYTQKQNVHKHQLHAYTLTVTHTRNLQRRQTQIQLACTHNKDNKCIETKIAYTDTHVPVQRTQTRT
jgi:hypothetical protein